MPVADLDPEDLIGKRILCAVDQKPFAVESNDFCILAPLCDLEGRRFESPEVTFRNRGRIWWMLKHGLDHSVIRPGTLFQVELEEAIRFDEDDPEKDAFQARTRGRSC